MTGIVSMAMQWLSGDKTAPHNAEITQHLIIESLLAEIRRVENVNLQMAEELRQIRLKGEEDLRRAVAEECAVICETADYAVRSYGCSHEIRVKFGLPMHKP